MTDFSKFPELSEKIVCVGRNYLDHIRELGNEVPKTPVFFIKPKSAYITSGSPVETPVGCEDLQHEIELGVVIGQTGKRVAEENAMDIVAGYALALDMTARDEQRKAAKAGIPWTLAKMFDTSCPVGEFIPKEAVQDPHNLDIWLKVNGEVRQKSNTRHFIFKIPRLIAHVSQYITLKPGDLLLTGTPAGVSRVLPGDVLDGGLESNGSTLTNISFKIE